MIPRNLIWNLVINVVIIMNLTYLENESYFKNSFSIFEPLLEFIYLFVTHKLSMDDTSSIDNLFKKPYKTDIL